MAIFMAALPSNFRFRNCHTCTTANLKGLLHLDTRSESSFLTDGFRNRKDALYKPKGFCVNMRTLCQNSDTIAICIKDVLLHMNLRIQDVAGSSMMDVRP